MIITSTARLSPASALTDFTTPDFSARRTAAKPGVDSATDRSPDNLQDTVEALPIGRMIYVHS
jgi:hypothetical protein